MDLQRTISQLIRPLALPTNNGQPQMLSSLGFSFNEALLSAALASATASKLDSPLGIVPYESAAVPKDHGSGAGGGDGIATSIHLTPTKKAKNEEPSSPVSSYSSTASTNFSSPQRSPTRKAACPIPDEKKDNAYFERRRKNNDAAKRSRDARRQKEESTARKATALEQENMLLKGQVAVLQTEAHRLHTLLAAVTSSFKTDIKNEIKNQENSTSSTVEC